MDAPLAIAARSHCEDQRVDLMSPGRVRVAGAEPRPEMQDCRIVGDRIDIRRVDRKRRVAIDRGVDACVTGDDLVDSASIGREPVHERRVGMEQPSEGIHVVRVPRTWKRVVMSAGPVLGVIMVSSDASASGQ